MGLFSVLLLFGLIPPLCFALDHEVSCGPTDRVCECDPGANVCIFQFYVEYVFTFAKYNSI